MVRGMSEPEAFKRLQRLAMDKRKTLREIAEAVRKLSGGPRHVVVSGGYFSRNIAQIFASASVSSGHR